MKMKVLLYLVRDLSVFLLLLISVVSCQDVLEKNEINDIPVTRGVYPSTFDWENIDFMPTPSGQTPIPSPWSGQGSIASLHGMDVVNDRKAADGWELLYNTFDSSQTAPLVNPYFVLYNKYSGIIRFYQYLTTQFVQSSSYVHDAISVVSTHQTTMLNFLGVDVVDISSKRQSYGQIQPTAMDDSRPLASNKWYMMQYELAYDPQMSNLSYTDIALSWSMNYTNVVDFKLDGELAGKITGTIGSSSNELSKAGKKAGETVVVGVLAGVGDTFLQKHKAAEGEPNNNTLGLSNSIFTSVLSGVQKAISGAAKGIPGAISGLCSAMFKGENSGVKMVNLALQADITLVGTGTEGGSFPSSPTSFWMPGTNIPSTAIGYLPLYNKPLGVFNIVYTPTNRIVCEYSTDYVWPTYAQIGTCTLYRDDEWWPYCLVINPEVRKIADVQVEKMELIAVSKYEKLSVSTTKSTGTEELMGQYGKAYVDPGILSTVSLSKTNPGNVPQYPNPFKCFVRYTVQVKPKNGAPIYTIVKTVPANTTFEFKFVDNNK